MQSFAIILYLVSVSFAQTSQTGYDYTIQAGDTCLSVAQSQGVTLGDIIAINPIVCFTPLMPKDTLGIVSGAAADCGPAIPALPNVSQDFLKTSKCSSKMVGIANTGANCAEIATSFGISLQALENLSDSTGPLCAANSQFIGGELICVPSTGYKGATGKCGNAGPFGGYTTPPFVMR